jgi:radical SAM superfamily enzyme YgiQ (UPF0313 family)
LSSWSPESFIDAFDVIAVGEGKKTMVEFAAALHAYLAA